MITAGRPHFSTTDDMADSKGLSPLSTAFQNLARSSVVINTKPNYYYCKGRIYAYRK